MRWKQFLPPVQSITAVEAADFIDQNNADAYTLLDVRQSKTYAAAHIAGATLLPLGELAKRLDELNRSKATVLY